MLKHKGFPSRLPEHRFPVHHPPRQQGRGDETDRARTLCRPQARRPARRRGLRRGALALFRGGTVRARQSRCGAAELAVRARGDPGRGPVRSRKLRGAPAAGRPARPRSLPRGLRRQRHLGGPRPHDCRHESRAPSRSRRFGAQHGGPIHPQALPVARPWHGDRVGPSPQFYPGRPRQDVLPFPFNAVGQATVPIAFFCRNPPRFGRR
jgi:hypothetical protein